jgi:hypothetical protein
MFFLGFSASDLLNQRNLKQVSQTEQSLSNDTKAFVLENKALLEKQDAVTLNSVAPLQQDDIFSWQEVQQLIANEHYEKAIALLEKYLASHESSAPAWFLLAQIYQRQAKPRSALNAWLRYFEHEIDSSKITEAFTLARNYFLQLVEKPEAYGSDNVWLMAQLNALLEVNINDGELHLVSASLFLEAGDSYQAQYHALMAVNDPLTKNRAEALLEKLNEKETPDEMLVPLIRYGHQYLVDVVIEGHSARLLLDTGASISGVSNLFSEKFPSILKAKKPIRLNTASGTVDSYFLRFYPWETKPAWMDCSV